jgi:hypothetical protein
VPLAASHRVAVAYRGSTASSDTFTEANNEACIARMERLFVKKERVEERKM